MMFAALRKIFGAAEEKSLADPTEEELSLFGGVAGGSLAVSASRALTVPAVSAAIRAISEAAACLDIKVARIEGGIETPAPEHPVAVLLKGDVCDWQSGFELVRDLTAQALTSNAGGLAWVNRVNDKVAEIIQYAPGQITVEFDPATNEPSYRLGGRPVPSADIIHLRAPFSRCPLSLAREAIGLAKTMEKRAGTLFDKSARPGGVVRFPGKLDAESFKRFRESWRQTHEGPDASGKTAILWDGADFKSEEFKSTDAQFQELRVFQTLEIARAFRVPPQMLYELDRATWGNSEQMGREFLTYSLEPWLRALESALGRALFNESERRTYRIKFDRDDLTRADIGSRATAAASLIACRALSPNEARTWLLDLPEGPAELNVYANPNTGSNQPGASAPQKGGA